MKPEALPGDAALVELRSEALLFETRHCLLPGTQIAFRLVMEERPLAVAAATDQCLVVAKDRQGYLFHVRVDLTRLPEADRQLIGLFIAKGRGSPRIEPSPEGRSH